MKNIITNETFEYFNISNFYISVFHHLLLMYYIMFLLYKFYALLTASLFICGENPEMYPAEPVPFPFKYISEESEKKNIEIMMHPSIFCNQRSGSS